MEFHRIRHFTASTSLFAVLALVGPVLAWAQAVGSCSPSVSEAYLDANNVGARILNNGKLFDDPKKLAYRIPRYSSSNAMYTAWLWIGGKVDGEIRTSASSYEQQEYWAGPMEDMGQPPSDCSHYDRIYKISASDVKSYNSTGIATPDLKEWPTGLGAPTLDAQGSNIDVLDLPLSERKDRLIDLEAGERPMIKGDQGLWWLMNDSGNEHLASYSPPLGLEIHGHAFAFASTFNPVHNATFYNYRIFNKSESRIEDAYIGFFMDPDLGHWANDRMGVDTSRGLVFVYNGSNDDAGDEYSYESPVPAFGFLLLDGALSDQDGQDNDFDGVIDEAEERTGLSHLLYYYWGCGVAGCLPKNAEAIYMALEGRWADGKQMTYGGNGRDYSDRPARFLFPGDPVTVEFWSEVNTDSTGTEMEAYDRKFIFSSGPLTLEPGSETNFSFAMVWARGADNIDSITELRKAADKLQKIHDDGYPSVPQGKPPTETVSLVSPADHVSSQPRNPTLYWNTTADSEGYKVELTGPGVARDTTVLLPFVTLTDLPGNASFSWRVRGETSFGTAPWSQTRHFSTGTVTDGFGLASFSVTANASGALVPPDMGAFAFNNSGSFTAARIQDRNASSSSLRTFSEIKVVFFGLRLMNFRIFEFSGFLTSIQPSRRNAANVFA